MNVHFAVARSSRRLLACGLLAMALSVASASPARAADPPASAAPADAPAQAPAVAQAARLLDAMRYEEVLRYILGLVYAAPPAAGESGRGADPALIRRWIAAMPLRPIIDDAAKTLAGAATTDEIEQGRAYFTGGAGRSEIACLLQDGPGGVSECVRERGGQAQYDAHRAFADTSIEDKLGDMLSGVDDRRLPQMARAALRSDPALKAQIETYCREDAGRSACALLESPAGATP